MIQLIRPDTPIHIVKIEKSKSSGGISGNSQEALVFPEDILCEWKNRFGAELYSAASEGVVEPARVRMFYRPGIETTHYVKRLSDQQLYEIVGVDDVENRHMILELAIKRYVKG